MPDHFLAPLRNILRSHFDLTKTQLETMSIIMFNIVNSRTVNLSHLASQFPGDALWSSNYRCLQRFFKEVHFDESIIAGLAARLLDFNSPNHLALDRTN